LPNVEGKNSVSKKTIPLLRKGAARTMGGGRGPFTPRRATEGKKPSQGSDPLRLPPDMKGEHIGGKVGRPIKKKASAPAPAKRGTGPGRKGGRRRQGKKEEIPRTRRFARKKLGGKKEKKGPLSVQGKKEGLEVEKGPPC